jgi:hypothetical protein
MARVTDPLDRAGLGDAAAAVRAEWRADEEEWTRAAFERWQHARTLVDVLRECMHRGDTVALRLPHETLTGTVQSVGDDLLALAMPEGRVDVNVGGVVPLVARIVDRARTGGTRGDAATTFRTRLLELEAREQEVEVRTTSGDTVRGLHRVGHDHLIVGEHLVAFAAVIWVRPVPE